MKEKILSRKIQKRDSLLKAIKQMDDESVKLLLVFDNDKFVGILTIGDIQRAIIKNVSLNDPLSLIMSVNKIYARDSDSIESIKRQMISFRAECMPVLNSAGDLVDVYLWDEIISKSHEIINQTKLDLPVVIMAGGMGKRLKPFTNVVPKPLIPIGEKTILETIMDRFENIGCCSFYMSVNYKSEIIKYYLSNIEHSYQIEYFKESKPLGTIGSVSLLKGKIQTPFFVSNCDIIVNQDLREVYDYHISNKNDITIVTAVKSYDIPYGVIETGENGLMKSIIEKPDKAYMINTGVYLLQPELIEKIPVNEFYHITHLINDIMQEGGRIGCFPVSEGSWIDIGDWKEYLKAVNIT